MQINNNRAAVEFAWLDSLVDNNEPAKVSLCGCVISAGKPTGNKQCFIAAHTHTELDRSKCGCCCCV